MTTRLTDLIVPDVFTPGAMAITLEKSALVGAGAIAVNATLAGWVQSAQGQKIQIPFLNDLDNDEADIASDDPAANSTPNKIGSAQEDGYKVMLHQSWGSMDILDRITFVNDVIAAIQGRVGSYWARQLDRRAIAVLQGVIADNIANDSGDMVSDIYSDIASPAASNKISFSAAVDAMLTGGDAMRELYTGVTMHSVVYGELVKQQAISFIQPSGVSREIPTYSGLAVNVSDQNTVTAGTNSPMYETLFYGGGVLAYGEGSPNVPEEVERNASAGNGGGQDILHSRREYCLHPPGCSYLGASQAGQSPTIAELALAANWNRVVERKRVPLAVLRHNG